MPTARLLVFLKYPAAGRVKTRLAVDIGPDVAAALYREWIGVVLRAVQPLRPGVAVVGYFDGSAVEAFAEWHALVDVWLPQPVGDLGARLAVGFAWGHRQGGLVVAIGTDCPEIAAEHVAQAIAILNDADAVFGPATDGGYYLVGTRQEMPNFFDDVRWSSPHTLADHLNRCQTLGLSLGLLPELADIDTGADWRAYQQRQVER